MNKQKILIIGAGGGREHAVGWKVAQSPRAEKLFFARGNAGTEKIGTNLDIKETETLKLLEFAKREKMDLTLVLSDDPLAIGMVDEFKKMGLRVWGPTKAAAQIEWSKAFSKDFMRRHNLPTAKFETFTEYDKALKYINTQKLPIVIKADGLAFGKGVVIAETIEEAEIALQNIMVKKVFGNSGSEVVIEEFLPGIEISIHAFSDGKTYKMFPPSQDHKKIGERNTGPNTGGIGTISPLPFVDKHLLLEIENKIVAPTLSAMNSDGITFEGILYPGLMLTHSNLKILEFNARLGDPETQTYMRLLETDLLDIVDACIDGNLEEIEVEWAHAFACTIVLASAGYPGKYEIGKLISGIGEAEKNKNVVIFHAGTKLDEERNLVTNGGRVLGVSATGLTLEKALNTAYEAISKIYFEGMHFRKDIGEKTITMLK